MTKTLSLKFILLSAAAMLWFCMASACSGKSSDYRYLDGIVWNTSFHIVYCAESDLSDSIMMELNRVEQSVSVFKKGSVTDRVNAGNGVEVDSLFLKVYEESRRINELSEGMFDPTISPIVNAWGFGKGHAPTADTLRIDSLLEMTGIRRTRIENMRLFKDDDRIQFNFSAIAKGYGCDRVGEMLRRNGVENFLVEIGGEIMARGRNSQGDPWTVSIDSPSEDGNLNHTSVRIIDVYNQGLATSGNYRNYHTSGNRRFGHTISPVTGRPIQTDVISATVLAPTAMQADAAATACMALGSKKGIALCDSLDYRVLLILEDNSFVNNILFDGVTNTAAKIARKNNTSPMPE